jgi:hypothetical protein
MTLTGLLTMLAGTFTTEWRDLSPAQQIRVADDFAELLRAEYDVSVDAPDHTMGWGVEAENAAEAARVYRRRIGRGNLAAYVKCLEVPSRRAEGR